jgi:caa(3)-type oxidase subunit IV
MSSSAHVSSRLYIAIWFWLAGLMLLGVVLSELNILPLSTTQIVWIVVALSTVKAFLVAAYYMHLKADRRLLLMVALSPLILIACALGLLYSSKLVKL